MPADDRPHAVAAVNLDDPSAFERGDPHRARDALVAFPEQCRRARALVPPAAVVWPRPRLVIVAGMGGSAAGGDLLAACAADRLDVPVLVHRGYGLPAVAGPDTLVIVASYSGETAEALSAAETALGRGCRLAVITSGGRLRALAGRQGLVRVDVPTGLMPRLALGFLFFPLLAVLRLADLPVVKDEEVDEALHVVAALGAELGPGQPADHNAAKRLALDIGPRLPVVYGGPVTGAVAYRWKTDLEENAKAFAVAGTLPEMNHNEIEAWSGPLARTLHLVLLRDHGEAPEIARRFTLLQELIGPAAGGVSEAWSRGRSPLARLLSLAYLGQWASYYLAVVRAVDPWPVPVLDALKGRLAAAR
jgi:glucose/mannose-6-phosphate isomerase